MTLSEMIDDVLLEVRNNHIGESENLSKHQIILWIKSYRSMLLKQKLDKGEPINDMFFQTLHMHLSQVKSEYGHVVYQSDEELPRLINSKRNTGISCVKDMFGNIIQLGTETQTKLQKYRKYTCGDYIAYTKDNRLCVNGKNNLLEDVEVKVIMEDPTSKQVCYDPDVDEYPMPDYLWPTIKDLIFTKDLAQMIQQSSDITNDSNNDNLNTFNSNLYRNTKR